MYLHFCLRTHLNGALDREKRKAIKDESKYWEDGEVYYEPIPDTFTNERKKTIRAAMDHWEKYTCLKFKESSWAMHRIYFEYHENQCNSMVGQQSNWYNWVGVSSRQRIRLADWCKLGSIVHEIGHAIGWYHEQSRPDRDQYLTIDWSKIPSNWKNNYREGNNIDYFNVRYDYKSVMHYGSVLLGKTVLLPKKDVIIGQRVGLSYRDIMLANRQYRCAESKFYVITFNFLDIKDRGNHTFLSNESNMSLQGLLSCILNHNCLFKGI